MTSGWAGVMVAAIAAIGIPTMAGVFRALLLLAHLKEGQEVAVEDRKEVKTALAKHGDALENHVLSDELRFQSFDSKFDVLLSRGAAAHSRETVQKG